MFYGWVPVYADGRGGDPVGEAGRKVPEDDREVPTARDRSCSISWDIQ